MKEDDELDQVGMTDDETVEVLFQDSMEYIDSDEERRLDAVVDAEHAKLYDMRRSNQFYLDTTKANVIPPRESVPHRASLRVRHRDLGLDTQTREAKQAALKAHDSQIVRLKDLRACYEETLNLSQNRSDVIQPSEAESGRPRPQRLSNDQTMRPSATSSVYEKKKLDYLKQKQRNNRKQIQLLRLHLKLKNQMIELKQLEQGQVVRPDVAHEDPTIGRAYGLAMAKLKNGTLTHEEPADKENCTIF